MLFTTLTTALAITIGGIYVCSESSNKICDYKELNDISGQGVMLSKNIRLSEKQSNEHVLMLAPSGAGKSRRFIMHNVNNLDNCSIVVTDPSGEIEKNCHSNKKKYIFNPFSNETIGYNPLTNCKNDFEVRKIAKVMLLNGMTDYKNDKFEIVCFE